MSSQQTAAEYLQPLPGEHGRVSGVANVIITTTITATTRPVRPVVFA